MFRISQKQFEELISQSLDTLPQKYISRLANVAIVTADIPSDQQRQKLKLTANQTLFGLYEGIPLTRRGSNYNLVLPDKITLFKNPLESSATSLPELAEAVHHTLWHEIAHYFGLDHLEISKLDNYHKDN